MRWKRILCHIFPFLPSLSMPPGGTSIFFPFRAFTLGRTLSVRLLTILVLNLIPQPCLAKLRFMCTACPVSRCHRWPHCILVCLLGAFLVSPGMACEDYENGTLSFIYIFIPVVCEYLASIWLSTCTINHYRTTLDCLRAVYLYFMCICTLFWAHASTTAVGSRSTWIVETGAISGKKLKKSASLCKSHTCYCH